MKKINSNTNNAASLFKQPMLLQSAHYITTAFESSVRCALENVAAWKSPAMSKPIPWQLNCFSLCQRLSGLNYASWRNQRLSTRVGCNVKKRVRGKEAKRAVTKVVFCWHFVAFSRVSVEMQQITMRDFLRETMVTLKRPYKSLRGQVCKSVAPFQWNM